MMKTHHFIALAAFVLAGGVAHATNIEVTGLFNNKAMVSINGAPPRVLSAGQTSPEGVKLISATSSAATFEIDGKRRTLGMGQSISTATVTSTRPSVRLVADGGGHFNTFGSINGRPIKFMVDTGATSVALSAVQARALGLDLRGAESGGVATASGYTRAQRVVLDSVKVGDITLNLVEAVVIDDMPGDVALLGNSFLSRLEMKREGQYLILTKTY